jgi:hypothetical protein
MNEKLNFKAIMKAIRSSEINGEIYGEFNAEFPRVQFITIDALKKEDWTDGIVTYSIYITFRVDLQKQVFKIYEQGNIALTKHDLQVTRYAMCTMQRMHEANGGKWFVQRKYKDAQDLAEKLREFWNAVHESLEVMTTGYPYKQMKRNVY